jgi:hypothetical protein
MRAYWQHRFIDVRWLSLLLVLLAGGLLGFAALKLVRGADGSTGVHVTDSRITFPSVPRLAEASDAIVVAVLKGERKESVFEPAAQDSQHGDTRVDVVRQFDPIRAIKGDRGPGSIEVRWTASGHYELSPGNFDDEQYDPLSLKVGQTYVLFLVKANDPATAPYWGLAGEPGIAELRNDDLYFKTTAGYRGELAQHGVSLGRAEAPAAFDVNIDMVAAAAR